MEEADPNAFILHNMPYFIAVNYQRVLEAQHPQEQVKLILHIYNLGLRALTSSLVNQYLIRDREKVNHSYLNNLLWEEFAQLTTSAWKKILFTVLRAYEGRQDLFFMPELHDFYWDTTASPYRMRSEVEAHFERLTQASLQLELEEKRSAPRDEAGWQALAEELKGHLQHILRGLSFLDKYDLIRVLNQQDDMYTFELHKGTRLSTAQQPSPKQRLTPGWFYLRAVRAGAEDFFPMDPWLMFWDKDSKGKELVPASIGVYDRMFYEQRLRYQLAIPGEIGDDQQHVEDFFVLIYETISKVKRKYQEAEKLTWVQLCDICEDITQKQGATEQLKYQKELYLEREHVRQQFETFLADPAKRGFVLVGKSGVGKSNFLLALGKELQQTRSDVCVLIYDGANLRISATAPITSIISQDFSSRVHLSGQEVQEVWREIDKIDGIQERLVIFCVDAINENPVDPAELLGQLNELVRSSWRWLRIVLSSRPETWQSIKRDKRVKLAETLYYREQGSDSAEVELKPFSHQELPEVYTKYQGKFDLQTPYESLSNELRETLRAPLNLWLLANAYEGQALPKTVKTSELIELYVSTKEVRDLLQREDRQFLEHELVPLMVGVGHYSNVITAADLDAAGGALYHQVFSDQVLSDGQGMNQAFLRLVDADILVRQKLRAEHQSVIQFKYERFYEYFVGKRLTSLSETQADRSAFFVELIEEIAGKKEVPGEKKTTSKPFLWGAIRNALVEEAEKPNSATILKLCRTTEQRVKEMMVDVLSTLGLDDPEQVERILRELVPQEKPASEWQKLRRVMRKAAKESEIVFRNAGSIAIEVASTLGIAWVLQQAALREDPSLRTAAVRYSYYLWQRDRAAGFAVLKYVAEQATAGFIPDFRAFESALGLSLIIFFEHHQDAAVCDRLQGIWRAMIATLFRMHEGSSPWKARVRTFIRERIIGFVISLVFRIFRELPSYNMVSYEALEAFFQLGTTEKALYRRLVHYFAVDGEYSRSQMEHDYREAIQIDNVLVLLTTLIGLVAHACAAPQAFLPFLKELFEAAKSEVATYPYLTIISNVAMEVLYRNPRNDEMFDFFVKTAEVCQEYYKNYPQAVHNRHLAEAPLTAAMAPYILFQYRREGTVKTAWLTTRIQAALAQNNLPFFDHLLHMELSQVGIDQQESRAALDTMELFFQQSFHGSLEEKNKKLLQEYSIAFLSRLRIHKPEEVDAFLEEQQAPAEFRLQLRTNEPVESVGDLIGKRGWYFVRDDILLGLSALRPQWMGLIEQAADSKNTKAWMDYNIRLLVNLIYGGQVLRQPKS